MAEYVEKNDVIELITRRYENPEICTQEINSIPAADVAPVVHGRWVSVAGKRDRICSRCLHNEPYKNADDDAEVFEFCPHCGAKMDGGDTFVAKRLRDSNAFPEVVTRCKGCKHLVAVNVNGKGIPTCRVSGMEVAPDEFCSRGEKGRR